MLFRSGWINNHTDERWLEMNPSQRDLNQVILIPGLAPLKIWRPPTVGVLFGASIERGLDSLYAWTKGSPAAKKGWEKFAASLANEFALPLLPTPVTPIIEHAANYNFFQGKPLVSSYLEQFLPLYQYDNKTSELTKGISRIVGQVPYVGSTTLASPVVLDNYLRKWTGTMGV